MENTYSHRSWMVCLLVGLLLSGCAPWVTIATPNIRIKDHDVEFRLESMAKSGRGHNLKVVVLNASNQAILERGATLTPGRAVVVTLKTNAAAGRVVRVQVGMPANRFAETRLRVIKGRSRGEAPGAPAITRAKAAPPTPMSRLPDAAPLEDSDAVVGEVDEGVEIDTGHRGLPPQPQVWTSCGIYLFPGVPAPQPTIPVPDDCVVDE